MSRIRKAYCAVIMVRLKTLHRIINEYHTILLPILLIIFAIIALNNTGDYDAGFLIEEGKRIVTTGMFPVSDWISMHSMHNNLALVLQQWPVCIIDYLIQSTFGDAGLFIYVAILLVLLSYIFYKIILYITKDYFITFILSFIIFYFISVLVGTPRPALYTILFISLAILCLLKSNILTDYQSPKIKYLFFLPVLSILNANFHSVWWVIFIGVVGIYLLYAIIKQEKKNKFYIAIIFLTTVFVALFNPYGYKALLFYFYTLPDSYLYSHLVEEMMPAGGIHLIVYLIIPSIFLTYRLTRSKKVNIPSLILYLIFFVMSLNVVRSCSLLMLFWGVTIAYTYAGNKEFVFNNKINNKIKKSLVVSTYIWMALLAVSVGAINIFNYRSELVPPKYVKLVEYLNTQSNLEDKTLFSTEVSVGQYCYINYGMRPFMDGRLEVYIESLNGYHDYFKEFGDVISLQDIDGFIDKYQFDYMCVSGKLYNLMKARIPNGYLIDYLDDNIVILKRSSSD